MEQLNLFESIEKEITPFYLEKGSKAVAILALRIGAPSFKVLWMDHFAVQDARDPNTDCPITLWHTHSATGLVWTSESANLIYKGREIFLYLPNYK